MVIDYCQAGCQGDGSVDNQQTERKSVSRTVPLTHLRAWFAIARSVLMKGLIIMNSVLLTLLVSILMGCSLGGMDVKTNNIEQIRIAIYPSSGGLSDTYYFVINSQNELLVEAGTRTGDDLSKTPFINNNGTYGFKSDSKQLTSAEVNNIFDLANKIFECDFTTDNEMVEDSWYIQILYKGNVVKQNYWGEISSETKELIDEFIKLSPIEVDLHGWS